MSRFTEKSQQALVEAQSEAGRRHHQAVDAEHLLLALVQQEDGLVPRLVERAGASLELLKTKVDEALGRVARVTSPQGGLGGVAITARVNEVLVRAQDEAKRLKDEYVSVEHLLLALFEQPRGSGVAVAFQAA